MKIDRLIGILMILINKEKITAKQLAEHFSVSVRTIQRDIDTLTLAGIPLYADVGVNGGYQLLEDYKLSKSFLNQNEANALIGFLKNIENAVPTSEVKSMINKFDALSENSNEPQKMVFHLNPGLDNILFQKHMTYLSEARDQFRKVKISYLNINYMETTRIICPYTLVMSGSTWYVYAYCELRSDFRMFKLFRIKSCEILSEVFELKDLPTPLPWEVTFDTRSGNTKIVLEIDKKLQGKLPEYFEAKLLDIQPDKIVATLDFPLDEWVYSLLMSMVPYIKILEPQFVREEFASRLKKCFDLNNYDRGLS
jgi:predicted DNA-binding transcriptional regulator YafY